MSDDQTSLDTRALENFIRALNEPLPTGRIGIIGKVSRVDGERTNVEIGIDHEFGTEKLPVRSFLRVPLNEHLSSYIENSEAFHPEVLETVIRERSVMLWMQKIMLLAQNVVLDAFNTGGFGAWKPSDMTRKKNHQTLVETGQLRDSITTEVA